MIKIHDKDKNNQVSHGDLSAEMQLGWNNCRLKHLQSSGQSHSWVVQCSVCVCSFFSFKSPRWQLLISAGITLRDETTFSLPADPPCLRFSPANIRKLFRFSGIPGVAGYCDQHQDGERRGGSVRWARLQQRPGGGVRRVLRGGEAGGEKFDPTQRLWDQVRGGERGEAGAQLQQTLSQGGGHQV